MQNANLKMQNDINLIQISKCKSQNDPEQIAPQLYGAGNSKCKIIFKLKA